MKGDFGTAEAKIPSILAKEDIKHPEYHHACYDIACIYALGQKVSEAVRWLRQAAETGFPCYPVFERDPYLNNIRQTAEFEQFMSELKKRWEDFRLEFGDSTAR